MTLFAFTWRSAVYDEALVVDDDGAVHLYVLVPGDDAHLDQVGTYYLPADADRVRRLHDASAGTGLLGEDSEAGDDARREFAGELRTEALAHPLAVLRATSTFISPVPSLLMTNVIVENIGTIDMVFELDPASLQVCWPGGTQPLPPPSIGFMDGSGQLIDGLYTPARLPAGSRAACSLIGDPGLPTSVTQDVCWVSFRGTLLIVSDALGENIDIAVPTRPFMVMTRTT